MTPLRTVILEHLAPTGTHFDWLFENPDNPAASLWAARVRVAPQHWSAVRRFDLTPLPPHRRRYLHYQGPLSRNRGTVRRVALGQLLAPLFRTNRALLDLRTSHFAGRLQLTRPHDHLWIARVLPH